MKNIKLPKIAIVGRPNVGKSSLFNRIIGSRKAIVESSSGTTRDRLHADIKWKGKTFTIVDTAGFEEANRGEISELVLRQIQNGVEEADAILFVTDGSTGIVPQDRELASMLRKTSKKIYLIVNKIDKDSDAGKAMEFFELGIGEPYAVSAMHNRGIDRLCNDMVRGIDKQDAVESTESVKVAIVGRPNVGKSSFLNSLLNEERVIVHPTAGTTRDAIDTDFNYNGHDYILIDTAGIRHHGRMDRAADFYGSVRSKEAVSRCDIALVLIDGFEGLTNDDVRIIGLCIEEGKGVVVIVNKWDLVENAEMSKYRDRLIRAMDAIKNFPVLFTSCKTGRNVRSSLQVIWSVYEKSRMVITPDKLKEMLKSLNGAREISGKRIRFKFLVQEGTHPPKFVLGIKDPKALNENLKRYVENFLKAVQDFEGVPIRIRFEKEAPIY